ncbi:MAG: polysaccharide pyruvyl transferase family protein [Sphingomonadaceae bacterium]|nr:polysaccharide pyruvyl transferase family protein [Sphingomonadaceae bacterium]
MVRGVRPEWRQRVGVLTFHRCINYGSYWQARCLVEGLRARGHDAMLLDHRSARVDRAEWRCALQPLLPARGPSSDRALYAAKARKFLAALAALSRSRPFDLDAPHGLEAYDLVLVGSDEVWNLLHPWYGRAPLFWGAGVTGPRLAAYGASFGTYDAQHGLDAERGLWLRRFDAISVRDANSRALARDATGREPALVLDPCLAFPPQIRLPDVGEPYLLVYGHSFPNWFVHAVRRVRERGWRLYSAGYRNDWADAQHLDAGPLEFARLVAGAAAVATNFFHGCVFALLHRKPFVCAGSFYRANKLQSLAEQVGTEARLLSEDRADAAAELLRAPLEPEVSERIAALRAQSLLFLDHVLA